MVFLARLGECFLELFGCVCGGEGAEKSTFKDPRNRWKVRLGPPISAEEGYDNRYLHPLNRR